MTTPKHFFTGLIFSTVFIGLAAVQPAEAKSMPPMITEASTEATTTMPVCPSFSMSLQQGMRDTSTTAVRDVQSFLTTYYKGNPESSVTGYFGPVTKELVQKFQTEKGLPVVGRVGPLTRAALKASCATQTPTKAELSITAPQKGTAFAFGDDIEVTWTASNTPAEVGMFIQLVTADESKEVIKSVIVPYASGTATITTDNFCNSNFSDAIYGGCENLKEILAGGISNFKIYAALYTPRDICFGFCASTATATIIAKSESATFAITNSFSADRTTGTAPLTTTFAIAKEGDFALTFGDGSKQSLTIPGIRCITAPCLTPATYVKHSYKKAGTYTATLTQTIKNTCVATGTMVCAAWYSKEEVVGTIAVVVTK